MGNKLSNACDYYRNKYGIDIPIFSYKDGFLIHNKDFERLNNIDCKFTEELDGCLIRTDNPLAFMAEVREIGFSTKLIMYRNGFGVLDIPDIEAIEKDKAQDY